MSFGFSIGDIVLLSQLAYNLYTSVSSGRKGASRDLKELEDVLFSLKCSLDHLGQVSKDVLARADSRQAGPGFKENLDRMINACASTLQELDLVTKEYREIGIDPQIDSESEKATAKKRTLNDVKKTIRVNWKKVRWDQEKQSLQQYREKLRSHTDAVNLILTSTIWANTIHAETSSKSSHNKTHKLLEEVLKNPQNDPSLQTMVAEIHAALTATNLPRNGHGTFSSIGYSSISSTQASSTTFEQQTRPNIVMHAYLADTLPKTPEFTPSRDLPSAVISLNNDRRSVGAKEYEAFKRRHQKPPISTKPAFLAMPKLNIEHLRVGIPHIFQALLGGRLEVDERVTEIQRWTALFVALLPNEQNNNSQGFVDLLVSLNLAIEQSDKKTRQLFYETSDSAGFMGALDQLQSMSKSVRVMKEIEEFQDSREEWEEGG